jgi:hypothetical protein
MEEIEGCEATNESENVASSSEKTPYIPNNKEYNADLKKRYEDDYEAELINSERLNEINEDLYNWFSKITRFGGIDKTMLIFYNEKEHRIKIQFWTTNCKYSIVAITNRPNEMNYLGCIMTSRKSRVGEYWLRGSDLHDGEYEIQSRICPKDITPLFARIENDVIEKEKEKLTTKK